MPRRYNINENQKVIGGGVGVEIERKFLPSTREYEGYKSSGGWEICQGYLYSDPDVDVRVRSVASNCTLDFVITIKIATRDVVQRREINIPINKFQAYDFFILAKKFIKKRRIPLLYPDINPPPMVDEFQDELSGLALIEVEFKTKEASKAFIPPEWFGKEVTGDPQYKNAILAR